MTARTHRTPAPMRLLLALVLALTLAACDSGTDEPNSAGVPGTWDPVSQSATMYGTVTETQTAIDLLQPGTGAITVSGAFNLSFRYIAFRDIDPILGPRFALVQLTDVDPSLLRVPRAILSLEVDGTGSLAVFVPGALDPRVFELVVFDGDAPVTLTDRGVEVTRIVMVERSTNAEVTVSGLLTHALRTYSAGEEAPIRGGSMIGNYLQIERTTFKENGDVRYPARPDADIGPTWTMVGDDSLRVSFQSGSSTTFGAEVDQRQLVLTSEAISPERCSNDCFAYGNTERAAGLTPGTLVRTRMLLADTFVRYR